MTATVSIHAPRAGRDRCDRVFRDSLAVSIHAPRAGRDAIADDRCKLAAGFNLRAPCGARPLLSLSMRRREEFQSTRPVRGATPRYRDRGAPL